MKKSFQEILKALPKDERFIIENELKNANSTIEKLKQNEEKYRLLVENTSNLVVKVDSTGKFEFVSKSYCDLFDRSETELLGNEFIPLVHEEDIEPTKEAMKSLFNPPYSCTFKQRAKTKFGWRWIEWKDDSILDANQNVTSIIGVGRDITGEIKIQEALNKSNEKFRNLMDKISNISVQGYKQDGTVFYWNKASENLYGYTADEAIGNSLFDLIIPESIKPFVKDAVEKMFESGEGNPAEELQLLHKNGNIVPVYSNHTVITTSNNEKELYCTDIDLTDRKLFEDELKKQTAFIQTVLDNLPIGVALNEINSGTAKYINKRFEEIYGWPKEELLDISNFFKKVYPDEEYRNKITTQIMSDINSGDPSKMHWENIKIKTRSGEDRFINAQNIPLFEQNTMVSTVIDMTSLKKAEKAIIESQRLGAIGEMSSAVAHDFNNSLQAILGNIELALIKQNSSKELEKYLQTIKTAANDASTRVQILQRFSGQKRVFTKYSSIDLNEVINDVIIQLRPIWKDNLEKDGIVVTIETSFDKTPKVFGNEGELRSVFYNILKNSIEAMPNGGKIYIQTSVKKDFVSILITDTGIGMNEETKSKIYQPFFTTKGFEVGRGLGMSGAYSIIKEHRGNINLLDSSPNNGTVFEIKIPISNLNISDLIKESPSNFSRSAKILWVDDEKMIRDVASEMLEVLGHSGDVVSSGKEALLKLRNNKYDLIVTDIGMPSMSGWELFDIIKKDYINTKVAFLTGWGDQIGEEKRKKTGINYILSKPFKITDLQKLISKMLSD